MRRLRRIVLALLLVVVLGAGTLVLLVRMPPAWYEPAAADDPQAMQVAEDAEYALIEAMHKIRPDGEQWSHTLAEPEVNAWLTCRMPDWIANRQGSWPGGVGVPQVHFANETVSLAANVDYKGVSQLVVADYRVELGPDGVKATLLGISAGNLPLPGDLAAEFSSRAEQALAGGAIESLLAEAVGGAAGRGGVELPDGRSVRLEGLAIEDGAIRLEQQTGRQQRP